MKKKYFKLTDRMKLILAIIILIMIAFVIGTNFGAHIGISQWIKSSAPSKGAKIVYLIKHLDRGETEEVKNILEIELDSYITLHWEALNGYSWPIWSRNLKSIREKDYEFMSRIVEYRMNNPSVGKAIIASAATNNADHESVSILEDIQEKSDQIITVIIKHYSKDPGSMGSD